MRAAFRGGMFGVLLSLGLGAPGAARAQQSRQPAAPEGLVDIVLENDATQDTDRYYSNALHVAYGRFLARDIWWAARLGHEIYTPRFLRLLGPLPGDRPYASYLFLQGELQLRLASSIHGVALRLGWVGPSTGGEAFQTWAHRMFGVRRPKGWHTQISDRPTAQIEWESGGFWSSRISGEWAIAAAGVSGIEAGNVRLRGTVAAGLMVGYRIDPADGPSYLSEWLAPARHSDALGFNMFIGGVGRGVLYDLFLDERQGVERNDVVGEFRVGVMLTYRAFRFRYVHAFTSPEFRAQRDAHGFGSFRLSVVY